MRVTAAMSPDPRVLASDWSVFRLAAPLAVIYAAAALPAAIWWPSLPTADVAAGALLALALIALTVVDLRSFRLPDVLTLPLTLAGIGIAHVLGWAPLEDRVIATAVGFLGLYALREAYFRLRGRQGLGLGDVKLFAAAGAWTGLEGLADVLLWGSVLALGCVGALALTGRQVDARTALPFGPFLAAGIWLVWLYGAPV